MTPLFSAYVWLRENPVVAWVAGAFAAIGVFLSWQRLRDGRIRREERRKIEAKSQKTAAKVIEKAKEKTHDVIERAEEARGSIPSGTPSGELPERTQDILFDD